jgi:LAO/AO transport system kinase
MRKLSTSPMAFIRPAPAAGTLGGVASRTRESMLVCEAAGYDVVLIETVGVGQSESMVAEMTDCFLILMLPGAGDELQGIKRGLLEYVDVIAINKADGETLRAAQRTAQQYDAALKSITNPSSPKGSPVVVTCSALQGDGVDAVWKAVEQLYQQHKKEGTLTAIRGKQNLRWMWSLVEQQIQHVISKNTKIREIRNDLECDVVNGVIPPKAAARQIIEAIGLSVKDAKS